MSPPNRQQQAQTFLEALFGDKPDDLHVLIWTLPGKESRWFTGLEEAAAYGVHEAQGEVYVGVGLSPRDFGAGERCKASSIAAIAGLWADIDIADETRKKPNLPTSDVEAKTLLSDLPFRPTMTVHSGGGYQAWWLFKEPWVFETEAERTEAQRLSRRFHETLRHVARRRGTALDATHDLARVLRLPGTLNQKIPGKPRPVRLLELENDRRYEPSELEELLADDPGPKQGSSEVRTLSTQVAQALRLSAGAQPPFDKFHALLENDELSRKTWDRVRKDLKDGSPSSYDLAMANLCVMAQWSDQEIADTLIAMRRKHGQDLKLRDDYYGLTIAKARVGVQEEEDVAQAHEVVEQVLRGEEPTIPPLEAVNQILGSSIAEISLLHQEPPAYRITLKSGKHKLFRSRHLQSFGAFELRYFELANEWPELRKRVARWKNIRKLIADHISQPAHQEDMGPEAYEEGPVKEWVEQYLEQNEIRDGTVPDFEKTATHSNAPWSDGEYVYLRLNHFRVFIERREFVKLEARNVPRLLRGAGLEPVQKRIGSTSRRYWCKKLVNAGKGEQVP